MGFFFVWTTESVIKIGKKQKKIQLYNNHAQDRQTCTTNIGRKARQENIKGDAPTHLNFGYFHICKSLRKKVTDVNEKSMKAKAKINQFLLTPRED